MKTNIKNIKLIALTSLFCGITLLSAQSSANENVSTEKNHDHALEKKHDDHQEKNHDESKHKEQDEHGHGQNEDENSAHEEESNGVKLSTAQLALAGIKVETLALQAMSYDIYAPGEIKANDYTSYLVSPRVDSIVVKRHVTLGDHVEKGQPLVTLFSADVAQAQANFKIAKAEWERVQQLGRKAVGDKRYYEAQANVEADFGRLSAFGLSTKVIESIRTKSNKNSRTKLGEYTLHAETSGAVLSDSFRQGQRVESGDTLIELADEHSLWIEAQLAPTMELTIPVGSIAMAKIGQKTYRATVTQKAHTIDPITRTRIVRLQVENVDHKLHPGLFADIYFSFNTTKQVLAVPEEALMRGSDGDWQVFVENKGEFKAVEVELGRHLNSFKGKWREISGIDAGSKVVIKGAFYVSAEIAKGGFDAHNH